MLGYLIECSKKWDPHHPLPSTTLHTIHALQPHFLSKIDTFSSHIPFFLLHSLASGLSHFMGPYLLHQASRSSINGAKDQPLPLLARYFVQGIPMLSSSVRKFLRPTSLKSHLSLGTRSLASSSKL